MRMDKLTSKFQTALADAQSMALGGDHAFIEPIHVMKALLEQGDGAISSILSKANVNLPKLRTDLDAAIRRLPKVEGTGGEIHISNELNRILNLMDKLAQKRKDQYISSELFLLAAIEDNGVLGDLLRQCGANKSALEKAVDEE